MIVMSCGINAEVLIKNFYKSDVIDWNFVKKRELIKREYVVVMEPNWDKTT